MDRQPVDPVVQHLQQLLNGCGYNFYANKNQARADDLLVRQKACASLSRAAASLGQLAIDFQRARIPPPSRDHPFPPSDLIGLLASIKNASQEVLRLEAVVRGMSVPSNDATWQRYREELSLLTLLLEFDVGLITKADAVEQAAAGLDANGWGEATRHDFDGLLTSLRDLAHERERLLTIPR